MIDHTKGMIVAETGEVIVFQWNPNQIQGPTSQSEYARIATAGRKLPFYQYSNGSASSISFEIEWSRYDNTGSWVKDQVDKLNNLTRPTIRGAGISRPPRIQLILGNFLYETCVLISVEPQYSEPFEPTSLNPHNARVGLTLEKYE